MAIKEPVMRLRSLGEAGTQRYTLATWRRGDRLTFLSRAFSQNAPLRPSILTLRAQHLIRSSPLPISSTYRPQILSEAPAAVCPILASIAPRISQAPGLQFQQIRCGPRNTTNRMTHLIRKRRIGFLARLATRTGRAILRRRRAKGRTVLTH